MRHTVRYRVFDDPYHVIIIKKKLTRTLPVIFSDAAEEVELALSGHIPTKGNSEQLVHVCPPVSHI